MAAREGGTRVKRDVAAGDQSHAIGEGVGTAHGDGACGAVANDDAVRTIGDKTRATAEHRCSQRQSTAACTYANGCACCVGLEVNDPCGRQCIGAAQAQAIRN